MPNIVIVSETETDLIFWFIGGAALYFVGAVKL